MNDGGDWRATRTRIGAEDGLTDERAERLLLSLSCRAPAQWPRSLHMKKTQIGEAVLVALAQTRDLAAFHELEI